ncbi:hypothetical protein [Clostridium fessum]
MAGYSNRMVNEAPDCRYPSGGRFPCQYCVLEPVAIDGSAVVIRKL